MIKSATDVLRREERVTLDLRRLYELYGYKKYRMGRFEEYELYLENKNFIKSRSIITFNDTDGKVLALKPDVTLSIVKNTHATANSTEKFYYLENVYRMDKQSRSYREISQLGLEYIGKLGIFETAEVVRLAMHTLNAIGKKHRLRISHLGFVVSLLDGLLIDANAREAILRSIRQKNAHELAEDAARFSIPPAAALLLTEIAALSGEFGDTMRRARKLAITQSMTDALDQLDAIYKILSSTGCEGAMMLDFSLMGDLDYYDGVVFEGYVEGVSRLVLSGGYYGNLLKKFGHELDAIGFALYLGELNGLYRSAEDYDVEALILYDEKTDLNRLAQTTVGLVDEGMRVRVEREIPAGVRYEKLYEFAGLGVKEVSADA